MVPGFFYFVFFKATEVQSVMSARSGSLSFGEGWGEDLMGISSYSLLRGVGV